LIGNAKRRWDVHDSWIDLDGVRLTSALSRGVHDLFSAVGSSAGWTPNVRIYRPGRLRAKTAAAFQNRLRLGES
jgi:hypothetical protein